MFQVGECDNPSSVHYKRPTFPNKPAEDCFAARSLEGIDLMWCQTHRQTIYTGELFTHKGCSVFVSTASLPVEDEAEMTLAGD
jgi:hypothetical protein